MFLDEELEEKYISSNPKSEEDFKNLSVELYKIMQNRIPDINDVSTKDFITTMKQINNSWNLFAKKHHEFIKDGFKNHIAKITNKETFDIIFN